MGRLSFRNRVVRSADTLPQLTPAATQSFIVNWGNESPRRKSGGLYTSTPALRFCRAGAAHRHPDHADPLRQAPRNLRDESERGHTEASRAGEEDSGGTGKE